MLTDKQIEAVIMAVDTQGAEIQLITRRKK